MSSNTIFISYSRKDSDFVTKFTKNLRDAGANLWLDKQIKPGGHWDASIESALETCQDVLLVLSKNSVNSNNVMDEVSYALEENKRVIPIKIEECDVPFRLRRIQHIDYHFDEAKGMEILFKALNLNAENSSTKIEPAIKKSAVELKKKEVKTVKSPVIEKKEIVDKKNELKFKKKGFLKYAIGAFIVIIALVYFTTGNEPEKEIPEDTSKSIETNSINEAIVVSDSDDWNRIKESIVIADFQTHLKNHIDCSHINEANGLIQVLQEVADEEKEWHRAISKDNTTDYLNYIMDYKKEGIFYEDALDSLDKFFVTSGFVQFSSSTGELYFSIFEGSTDNIPQIGDLIFANSQRNIHKGPYGTSNFGINIHTTSVDEVFKVKNVQMSGRSFWVEVSF
ncbi:toll/interleukin-1 receptor domain-containing protein [uncultured Lutibacter sp.]|mgnify:CR=1 FL=1|uniref:toll/interleukin-1 receptor domain-containing protein n=1 Tax=uncultured Lutibacter sp. TaxID=437739 RepID=UPI00262AC0C3|nr:toll/interleukin-1 receptor domain-containing protein [uncultured Lutibacter sp.]